MQACQFVCDALLQVWESPQAESGDNQAGEPRESGVEFCVGSGSQGTEKHLEGEMENMPHAEIHEELFPEHRRQPLWNQTWVESYKEDQHTRCDVDYKDPIGDPRVARPCHNLKISEVAQSHMGLGDKALPTSGNGVPLWPAVNQRMHSFRFWQLNVTLCLNDTWCIYMPSGETFRRATLFFLERMMRPFQLLCKIMTGFLALL